MYPDESEIRDNNVIEVLLNRLRQKLKAAHVNNAIETRRGLGYCFVLPCKNHHH
uniref:helix-turn-helix domain-containing protein n=1 Tax=Endozoicomonas sp. Mp262 TaxID=2919499 RepID=UPI00351B65A2